MKANFSALRQFLLKRFEVGRRQRQPEIADTGFPEQQGISRHGGIPGNAGHVRQFIDLDPGGTAGFCYPL